MKHGIRLTLNRQSQLAIYNVKIMTIGIILCKSADKEYVEYIIQDYNKPMGVATYTTENEMPENLRAALPPIEELKKLL